MFLDLSKVIILLAKTDKSSSGLMAIPQTLSTDPLSRWLSFYRGKA